MRDFSTEAPRPATVEHAANCVLFLTGALALILPKTIVGLLPILAILAGLHTYLSRQGREALLRPSAVTLAFGAFFVLAAASAIWAEDPKDAFGRGLFGVAAVVSAHVLVNWVKQNSDLLRRATKWFLLGFMIGLVFILVEAASHQMITTWILGDLLKKKVAFSLLNLNLASANLLVWPVLLSILCLYRAPRSLKLAAIVFGSLVVATFLSEHETTKLAVAASIVTFTVAYVWPKLAGRSLQLAWVVIVLMMVPLAYFAHQSLKLDQATWLQPSGQHRIIIWGNLAERTTEAPILGHGARSIYKINADDKVSGKGANVLGEEAIPPHAHNVYLQTWFELGAIGAVLMAGFGVMLVSAMLRLPQRAFPFAISTGVNAMVQLLVSFEIWQLWFLALLAFGVVLMGMAAELATEDDPQPSI